MPWDAAVRGAAVGQQARTMLLEALLGLGRGPALHLEPSAFRSALGAKA